MLDLQKRLRRIYLSFWTIAACIYGFAFQKAVLYDPNHKINTNMYVGEPYQDIIINGLHVLALIVFAGTIVISGILLYLYAENLRMRETAAAPANAERETGDRI